ncbi:MAG TPA: MaoC/PaaZ C-terminal domain-containing protein [Actinomycetota bacterium]|nr:MaoC/PaaZ C-terminal domain-containing protein [Actinomycetota bacterium]
MPIDVEKVLSADLLTGSTSWGPDDIILYHLGIGAGVPPTDPGELEYCYEQNLKVLPTFGVVTVVDVVFGLMTIPGMQFNIANLLQSDHDLEIHRPIPTSATVTNTARVTDVFDRKLGASVVSETTSSNEDGPLFTNRFSAYIKGEGGFGGERGPRPGNLPPEREPDHVVESPTLPQQTLLYRLSGDKNPIHADPSVAAMGGFDRPIMHGLCWFGMACKAVVDRALGGDTTSVMRFQGRFGGVMYPGETLVTSMWQDDKRIIVRAVTKERGAPVLTNAAVETH